MNIEELQRFAENSMVSNLGIKITDFSGSTIEGTMPVDNRTVQPYRILHGGATVALAETLGSFGSYLNVDSSKFQTVGLEVNCNHIRPVKSGNVKGVAKLIHKGRKTHIWNIEVFDENEKLVAISRLTVMIIPISNE